MKARRGPGLLAAIVAAAVALAYLLPFRDYGLNFEDEGAILYSIQRVVAGDLPYVDFGTGYTPGYYYLMAALWRVADDLPTLRALLACVHAATVAGLALLSAQVAPPILAVVVPLLYLGFIPAFPGGSCAFNIPYPAWFATLAWVAMGLALVGFVRARGRIWLVVATLAAAAALATKPNAGVFALAAVVGVVLLVQGPAAPAARRASLVWWTMWGGILVGPWVTLGLWPGARDAVAYLIPLSALLLALPARPRTQRAALVGDVSLVLGIFTAVSLPWLAFFWSRLGMEGFLREVLLIGSGAAQLYYLEYPPFEPWAVLTTAVVGGLAVAGFALRADRIRLGSVVMVGAFGLAGSLVAIKYASVMPERTVWSLIWQLETAGFPLALATHVAGVVWFWGRRTSSGGEVPAALLLCALFMHLQLYPRADFTHLIVAVPLTMAFAAFLLGRVLAGWRAALGGQSRPLLARAVTPIALAAMVTVLALRVSPSLAARFAEPGPRLPFAVAPVGVERTHSAVLADLTSAATRLAALVPPGGTSLTFPAIDVLLFLTETRNPSPFVYFFPGRPDHREEAEIVDILARMPPASLVSLNSAFTFFDDAPPYYFLLRRFVRSRYALAERSGRFDVLALAEANVGPVVDTTHENAALAALAPLLDRPLAEVGDRLLALATEDDASMRRAALTALMDRLGADPGGGTFETRVAEAHLDRRREVLLLRTIRDTRDARAASYLFAAATRPDPRIANEALGAMFVTRAQLIAGRNLWAGAREPAVWPARNDLVTAARRVLADASAPPRATALAAELAGVLGDTASVPLLRGRLAGDPATAASAAAALVRVAPDGLACDLVARLARPEPEMRVLMPTVVLDLAERDGSSGREARTCLVGAVSTPGPAREPAIWVAAALAEGTFAPGLRAALLDEAPSVRRAAAWALGEMPTEVETGAVLARAAELDPDATVRRLALGAAAKQSGAAPRAALATSARARSAG